ncbi:MAG TPA: hypothetical protein VGB01_03260 [candidate division Zixibacteria bacterium]
MSSASIQNPEKPRCDFCGKRFKKGGTRYRLRLELFADFDGYLEDFSEKPENFLKERIEKILKQTEDKTEKELEEEIYLRKYALLCISCRDEFLKSIETFEKDQK